MRGKKAGTIIKVIKRIPDHLLCFMNIIITLCQWRVNAEKEKNALFFCRLLSLYVKKE